jgi:CcmD family protein
MEQQVQAIADSLRASDAVSTAYDSIWSGANLPTKPPTPLEQVMLSDDKIFVVLVVVLIIWFGIMFFVYRTDSKLKSLERNMGDRIDDSDDDF